MPLAPDALVANPGRLRILTSLAAEPSQEFVQLRGATRMTDGNLSSHARRLQSGGLIAIDKTFRAGKPVTTISLTTQGREALKTHVQHLTLALASPPRQSDSVPQEAEAAGDDWVD